MTSRAYTATRAVEHAVADGAGRTVAFLAHRFPPLGGGGTPRSVKFVKYLATHGWRPVVYTGSVPERANRAMTRDDSQSAEIAGLPVDVVRLDDSPSWLAKTVARLPGAAAARAVAYPWVWEPELAWADRVVAEAVRRHPGDRYAVIFATAAPQAALLAAARLSDRLGVPFVVDLRDLWTCESLKFYPSRLHYLWESRLEHRILGRAAAVIANTPGAADVLARWLGGAAAERVVCIPNGFDPAEAPQAAARRKPARPDGTIQILHAGTLWGPAVQRSRFGRYRPLALADVARSVEPLARGILALERIDPALARRLRVRLLGYAPPALERRIGELGLADRFSFEGVVSRRAAMAAMEEADALLALQVAFEEADRPVPYVPGKVFEYLPHGTPILGPVPPGDLRDLLDRMPHAYACDYRDADAIAATLRRMCADIESGGVRFDPAAIAPYSRVAQAAVLAGILDAACTRGRR